MKKFRYWALLVPIFLLAIFLAGCKGVTPVVLKATGQLRQISLSWTESKKAVGYNVYRRTGETGSYVKLNGTPLVKTVYADAITSPEGDGVFYHYYVTAVPKKGEEVPSNKVRSMHGTRPASTMEFEGNLALGWSELSPFVVDPGSELIVNAVTFLIPSDVTLYLLEGSKLSMRAAAANYGYVYVYGTLLAQGTAEDPVIITSHSADGSAPSEGKGFGLGIRAGTDQLSTSLRYARISNLNSNGLRVESSSAIIEQCHIGASPGAGNVSLEILNSNPQIRNCAMENIYLLVRSMSAAFPGLEIKDNSFSALTSFSVRFTSSDSSTLLAGQITSNSFTSPQVELNKITGSEAVKLGGNYWGQETAPSVTKIDTTVDADFAPLLTAAPANIGPSW